MSDTLTIQELAHRLATVEAVVGITAPYEVTYLDGMDTRIVGDTTHGVGT